VVTQSWRREASFHGDGFRRQRIAVLIMRRSRTLLHTLRNKVRHWRRVRSSCLRWSPRGVGTDATKGRCVAVQRLTVIGALPQVIIGFERCELRELRVASHSRRAVGSRQTDFILCESGCIAAGVVVLTIHLGILGDALLARLPRNQGPPHSACDKTRGDDQNRGGQDNPSSPLHVRNEEENVDQKCQQGDEQGGKGEDEQGEQVSRRVSR